MDTIKFNESEHLSIGVEIELQLLDNKTLDLCPRALSFLEQTVGYNKIKPEIFQSMIEATTDICCNVHEIKADLQNTFTLIDNVCEKLEIQYATTGTHPFAKYIDIQLFPSERYYTLIDRNQWIAQRLCIFGLHVHLGMKNKEDCIDFMNMFQWFLPLFAALSTSSPFWQTKKTGLHSSRLTIFEASPTSGHCSHIRNWGEFEQQVILMKKCKTINSTKDLWWDIRPAPHYGTLEIRICDGVATLHELLGILTLIHSVAHFYEKYKFNYSDDNSTAINFFSKCPMWLIREHKWRAIRHGLEMNFITSTGENISLKKELLSLLEILQPTIKELNYQEYIDYLQQMINHGNSSVRQLKVHSKYKSLKKIAQFNAYECKASFTRNINCITKHNKEIKLGS